MGFGKKVDPESAEESSSEKKKKASSSKETRDDGFVPSTKKDLKEYAARAKRKEVEKKERKHNPREADPKKVKASKENLEERRKEAKIIADNDKKYGTELLAMNKPFKGLKKKALIRQYAKLIKERAGAYLKDKTKDKRWKPEIPAYEDTGNQKIDDSNFLYEVQASIAHFSWKELDSLVAAGIGGPYRSTNFTSGFHYAMNLINQALGVREDEKYGARYYMADRDAALELWPVEPKVKKMKTKKAKNHGEDEETPKKKKRAKRREEEEEEEEYEEVEEKTSEEEEEEETDEDEETPVKKKSAKKKAAAEKPEKAAKPAGKLKGTTIIATTSKDREGGGKKGKLYSLVTKKGVTFDKLLAAAAEEDISAADAKKWVPMMIKNGFLQTK